MPPDRLERAFDDVVRRGANPVWLRQTASRAAAARLAGPRLVLDLIDQHLRRGTVRGSWFECLVERCLVHPELRGLERQFTLRGEDGAHVATFDVAVPDARLGIEGHSRRFHFGASAASGDERRDNEAGALGWDVMYVGYADVHHPERVLDVVLRRVRARRAQIGARMEHGTSPG